MSNPIRNIESLSTKIQDLVDMLRTDRHSRLGISEVAAVTEVLIATAGRYFNSLDTALYQEFNNLSEHLSSMHEEIAKVQANKIKSDKLPSAGEELDAIVQATETATDTIMGTAEDMMAGDIADPTAYKALVDDACMRIFEACSFQDITGQRITKVVTTLAYIEDRISQFAMLASDSGIVSVEDEEEPTGDAALMHGPQMAGDGASQDDVDALMNGDDAPAAVPEPAPEPAPKPKPVVVIKPRPAPKPAPKPAQKPVVVVKPKPAPQPAVASAPVPAPAPEAAKKDADGSEEVSQADIDALFD